MAVLEAFVAFIAIIVAWGVWRSKYWVRRGVPQAKVSTSIWAFIDFLIRGTAPSFVVTNLYRKTKSPYIGFYKSMLSPTLMVKDPDLVKEVLQANFSSFHDNEIQMDWDPMFRGSPFSNAQEKWKSSRAKFAPLFTPSRVKIVSNIFLENAQKLIKLIESLNHKSGQGNGAEVKGLIYKYTNENSINVSLGLEAQAFDSKESVFVDMTNNIFSNKLVISLSLMWPQIVSMFRMRLVSTEVESFFKNLVKDAILHRQKSGEKRHDILNIAEVLENGPNGIKPEFLDEMTSRMLVFFVESIESATTTTVSSLLLLAINKEEQRKLRQEVQTAFPDGKIDTEELMNLPYMDMVVSETMRLYPIMPVMTRMCTKPITLTPAAGKPIKVESGTPIAIPVRGLHRDPQYYPDPDEFRPERFSKEAKESRHKFVYLPFGEGPRICIGLRYGLAVVKVALASILLNFDLEVSPKQLIPPQECRDAFLPVFEGGVWLRFVKRT